MSFDEIIDRFGTHSVKWDMMEPIYGVPADDGIAMWVADMDFRPPQCVSDALVKMNDIGIYGYYGDDTAYLDAIRWWMKERHNWDVAREEIFTTHGLVNGTAMCVDAFTKTGRWCGAYDASLSCLCQSDPRGRPRGGGMPVGAERRDVMRWILRLGMRR